MSRLLSPLTINGLKLSNRVALSPMCQYKAIDGLPGAWHQAHYGARAIGGVGLVVLESTAISADGRITPGCLGLWNDQQEQALGALVANGHDLGTAMGIQLNHAGRKGSAHVPWMGGHALGADEGTWPVAAPSAVPHGANMAMPFAMSRDDIERTVSAFAAAARRAVRAGFDVIELHLAHGYLLHQFLSPLSNHREDEFGGDFEGRTRFPLQALQAIRSVMPATMPLFVRLSCSDGAAGGWTLDESVHLARLLREAGADLIDCTSGGIAPPLPRPAGVAFNAEASQRVRAEAGVATATVGGITDAAQAEQVLSTGQADLLFLGRALLSDPFWALRAHQELVPSPYLRAPF